jgi:hypothetical protein
MKNKTAKRREEVRGSVEKSLDSLKKRIEGLEEKIKAKP